MSHPFQVYTWRKEPWQTVYVLGAGASRAERKTVPMNSNLLAKILVDTEVEEPIRRNVRSFLREVYGAHALAAKNQPNFEEVFTLVELALSEGRYFPGWPESRIDELRKQLIIATGVLLRSHLPKDRTVHETFITQLFNSRGVSWENTSFMSFNYDISLDMALISNQKEVGDVDYGFYARSYDVTYDDKKRRWDPANPQKTLLLMKPHGSFNWTWCPICGFMVVFPKIYAGVDALQTETGPKCTKCHGRLDPLIIPPAWGKSYRNPTIMNIWQISEYLISQAELLVFIGYSFSDADVQFKFLLRRALNRKKKPKVLIVSNQPGSNNETYRRYARFFGDIEWEPIGFRKFARKPIHAIDVASRKTSS